MYRTFLMVILVTLISLTQLSAQLPSWQPFGNTDYCDNVDIMIDSDKGALLANWNITPRDMIEALESNGFEYETTDSSVKWKGSVIESIEAFFDQRGLYKTTTTYIVPLDYAKQLVDALKKKFDRSYVTRGQYSKEGQMDSYQWVNRECSNTVATFIFYQRLKGAEKTYLSMTTARMR